jgi:tRNA pseudouridine38-40 synthase
MTKKSASCRLKLTIEYDGTNYAGWQRQKNALTVQEILENAFQQICGQKVGVYGAGRTDSGVHARAQTAHVSVDLKFPVEKLRTSLNAVIPEDIVIIKLEKAGPDFHARYDSKGKIYRYTVSRQRKPPVFTRKYVFAVPADLDIDRMREAAGVLLGKHDFRAFYANDRIGKRDPVREIKRIEIIEKDNTLIFEIEGSGFLYKMVRTIVGTVLEAGKGNLDVAGVREILESRDIRLAGPTAPSKGLCLWEVKY